MTVCSEGELLWGHTMALGLAQCSVEHAVTCRYGQLSEPDITESEQLLLRAFSSQLEAARTQRTPLAALGEARARHLCTCSYRAGSLMQASVCSADCGAGVGRVSERLLLRFFQEVQPLHPMTCLA